MPQYLAGQRVIISEDVAGRPWKVTAKNLLGRAMPVIKRREDQYDEDASVHGQDALGRNQRFALMVQGNYTFDVETVEGYANALLILCEDVRAKNREYAQANNRQPVG